MTSVLYWLQSTAMTDIVANLHLTKRRLVTALQACGRTHEPLTLVAVSKSHPAEQIATLFAAGQQDFGENYLDEALLKIAALSQQDIIWHYIGTIQSKKAQDIAQNFSWVHTVCRLKEAALLSQYRASLPPLNICLQVSMDDSPKRNGVSKAHLFDLIEQIKPLPHLILRGLMVLPPFTEDLAQQRAYFADLRTLYEQCNNQGAGFDTLSMGMTHDFEAAIKEGTTMVRIGTGIFGPRGN